MISRSQRKSAHGFHHRPLHAPDRRIPRSLAHARHPASLLDIRTIPKSRRNPQFNTDALAASLQGAGIRYVHMKDLGGLRHSNVTRSISAGATQASAASRDYMQTPAFAELSTTAIHLAERNIASSPDVRRGGSLALPSVACRGRTRRARHSRPRNHQRRRAKRTRAHALRSRAWPRHHLSRRPALTPRSR